MYKKYTDDELYETYSDSKDYSGKASDALNAEIAARGGMEKLLKRLEEKNIIPNEIKRITREVYALGASATDSGFLKTLITSAILPEDKLHEVIDRQFAAYKARFNDKAITPRTIAGGITGIAIASVIGAALWFIQMQYLQSIIFYSIVVLFFICYGVIRLITRQSAKNAIVLIATVLATVLSIVLGMLLYNLIGR